MKGKELRAEKSGDRLALVYLPSGLEASESLQVLQLSFNRISTLRPGDLSNLRHLTELHLQHNLIASLHPQTFQDLAQLRVSLISESNRHKMFTSTTIT